jgi:hypothetical protein
MNKAVWTGIAALGVVVSMASPAQAQATASGQPAR